MLDDEDPRGATGVHIAIHGPPSGKVRFGLLWRGKCRGYAAAFYAFEADGDTPAVIWAFPQWQIWGRAVSALHNYSEREGAELNLDVTRLAEKLASEFNVGLPFILPVLPRSNARMAVQQGMFLMLGAPHLDAIRNLAGPGNLLTSDEVDIVKLVCPKRDRLELLRLLREMNIGRDTLFPDLDGLARSTSHDAEASLGGPGPNQRALLLALRRPSGWPGAPDTN